MRDPFAATAASGMIAAGAASCQPGVDGSRLELLGFLPLLERPSGSFPIATP
jgi:hypothetical protein